MHESAGIGSGYAEVAHRESDLYTSRRMDEELLSFLLEAMDTPGHGDLVRRIAVAAARASVYSGAAEDKRFRELCRLIEVVRPAPQGRRRKACRWAVERLANKLIAWDRELKAHRGTREYSGRVPIRYLPHSQSGTPPAVGGAIDAARTAVPRSGRRLN